MSFGTLTKRVATVACALVLSVVPTFGLVGCTNEEDAVKAVVDAQLDSIKTADADAIRETLSSDANDQFEKYNELYGVDPIEFYTNYLKHFDYEDKDVTIDGDEATVSLNVTNVDLESVVKTWKNDLSEYQSSAQFLSDFSTLGQTGVIQKVYQQLIDVIGEDDAPTKTTEVDFKFKKVDGQWQAADGQELVNVLFAGADLDSISL